MLDFIYVLGTIAFFSLMLAYAAGCEQLGRSAGATSDARDTRP